MRNSTNKFGIILLTATISLLVSSCYTMQTTTVKKVTQAEYATKVLHRAIFDYVEESLYIYPQQATRMGMHIRKLPSTEVIRLDRELPNFSESLVLARLETLRKIKERLDQKAPIDVLSLNDRADRKLFMDAIDFEILRMEEQKVYTNDPLVHVGALAEAMYYPIILEYAPEETRLSDVLGRMHWIPSFVDRAMHLLTSSSNINLEAAIRINAWTIDFIKNEIGPKMVAYPVLQKSFLGMYPPIIASLERLQDFLKDDIKKNTDRTWQLGADRYDRYFALAFHGLSTPGEISAVAENRVDAINDEIFALAKPHYCKARKSSHRICSSNEEIEKKDRAKVIAWAVLTMDKGKGSGSPAENLKNQFEHAAEQAAKHNVLSSVETAGLTVDTMPDFMRATGNVFFFDAQPVFQKEQGARVLVANSKSNSSLTHRSKNRMFFTSSMYASPGKFELFRRTVKIEKQTRRAIRMLHADHSFVEGWALYAATKLSDKIGDDNQSWKTQVVALLEELQAAAKLLVDVGMHTGQIKDGAARSLLRKKAHMSRAMARNVILGIKLNPTEAAASYLGLYGFEKIEKDLESKEIGDKALEFGPVPTVMLAEFFKKDPDEISDEGDKVDDVELERTVTIFDALRSR